MNQPYWPVVAWDLNAAGQSSEGSNPSVSGCNFHQFSVDWLEQSSSGVLPTRTTWTNAHHKELSEEESLQV
jgi:hypothetical protein